MIIASRKLFYLMLIGLCTISCSVEKEEEKKSRPIVLVLIADDWSYPHAGVYEESPIETTTFNKIATDGVFF